MPFAHRITLMFKYVCFVERICRYPCDHPRTSINFDRLHAMPVLAAGYVDWRRTRAQVLKPLGIGLLVCSRCYLMRQRRCRIFQRRCGRRMV